MSRKQSILSAPAQGAGSVSTGSTGTIGSDGENVSTQSAGTGDSDGDSVSSLKWVNWDHRLGWRQCLLEPLVRMECLNWAHAGRVSNGSSGTASTGSDGSSLEVRSALDPLEDRAPTKVPLVERATTNLNTGRLALSLVFASSPIY